MGLTRRSEILNAMGVTVWFPRPSHRLEAAPETPQTEEKTVEQPRPGPAPDAADAARAAARPRVSEPSPQPPPSSPEPEQQATPRYDPVSFDWCASERALVLCGLAEMPGEGFIMDVLHFVDWLGVASKDGATYPSGKPAQGAFRWPQLGHTTAGPKRPLSVFLEKHHSADKLVLVTPGLAEQITPLLDAQQQTNLRIVDLFAASNDLKAKETLWRALLA